MRKVIAIIDDEREMEFIYPLIFREQLEKSQLELNFFHDSQIFLEWLKTNQYPDLCMVDIEMPQISGPEILRATKMSEKKIPTYFVSGHDARDFQEEIEELKVSRFLTKPFSFIDLLSSVKNDLNLACNLP